jgi:hypothetical protein
MKRKPVLAAKYLPTRPVGLFSWLTAIIALDYFAAPLWLWYTGLTLFGVFTIGTWLVLLFEDDACNPAELLWRTKT